MKAFVLAAGKGTRLRPFTDALPKPLMPVINKPVMAHILGLCRKHGFDEIVANLHYRGEKIVERFADGHDHGVCLQYSWEEQLLGTAGGVRRQAGFLAGGPFLVISGDVMTDLDLGALVRFHKQSGAVATMAVKEVGDPSRFGVVVADPDGRVRSFQEKPAKGTERSRLANTGIYVLEPEVFEYIPEAAFFDFGNDLFPLLVCKGAPVYAMGTGAYWSDVGTLSQYLYTHWELLTHPEIAQRIGEGTVVQAGAVVSEQALIGSGCTIEKGARVLGYSCVSDGCTIRADSVVVDSVVWTSERWGHKLKGDLVRSIWGDGMQVSLGLPNL
ncbi:sugar phosphate nucleotidyltransferase [Gloeobacter violaceus]|uniref:Mannose-1-phosphate guanylyltransferase n=1 Tax=Gloeobacter violaceus (strain ATCC 29082 / PCC 7421) TaxID=251221 RepID=Q7NJQ0_GLOVI|nr:sugar phosphate nucleotidyltransferase [Gloeobacter violaceus]BAC89723.1 mannose-1-phosphate guanylyltransferase [Gloeobacter violaceus PCC 7421]